MRYKKLLLLIILGIHTAASYAKESSLDKRLGSRAREITNFFADFQTAVVANNKEKLAHMIRYPISPVLPGNRQPFVEIKNQEDFRINYDQMFNKRNRELFSSLKYPRDCSDYDSSDKAGILCQFTMPPVVSITITLKCEGSDDLKNCSNYTIKISSLYPNVE